MEKTPLTEEQRQILDRVSSYVIDEMKHNDPAHDGEHVHRVVELTRALWEKAPQADPYRAELLAWLHDMQDDKLQSNIDSHTLKKTILSLGLTEEDMDFVMEGIPYISYRNHPKLGPEIPLEIRIVQDADRIDAMGAIGIARTFAYGGSQNRPLEESIRHFEEKLLCLYDLLSTEAGKRIALPRYTFLKEFYDRFREEQMPHPRKKEGNTMEFFLHDAPIRSLTEEERYTFLRIFKQCNDQENTTPLTANDLAFVEQLLAWRCSEEERKIMSYRLGLPVGNICSIEDTAEAFGVSRERIRQVEQKAVRKLLRVHLIRSYPISKFYK